MKSLVYLIFCICTAMVGYTIHGSVFWSIMDFIFTAFAWIKWLILHEVTLDVLQRTFNWFC
jgi:hypothetical protein